MRRKLRYSESVTYWKSMVDVITVLMMVILLILMFFVLNFLTNNKDKDYDEDDYDGYDHGGYNSTEYTLTPTPTVTSTPTPTPYVEDDNGGGGGESTTTEVTTETTVDEEYGFEGHDRAAVYVIIVDEETNQPIEVPFIRYELYSASGNKQTLSTHYPELVSYTEFETTEGGWFYLPEKIREGSYYFHQLTEIPGYDFASDYYFTVDEAYEWDSPLVVKIPIGPSKNNIQVQVNDANTGIGLSGVVFNVVANGDVITPDGTIRYLDGENVDVIECDETGYGLSHEIYIGNYRLVPRDLPFGYAAPDLPSREIELPRRTSSGSYAPLVTLLSKMTAVRVTVSDELDESILLSGVTYQLRSADDPDESRIFVSNSAGFFEISNLMKNSTYTLTPVEVPSGYIPTNNEYTFTVDAIGLISSNAVENVNLTNRMIRIQIYTTDRVLKTNLYGYNVSLYDQNGNEVYSWVSDGSYYSVNGIETGIYTLKVENSDDKTIIVVEDVKDIQKFSMNILTTKSYVLLGGVALLFILVIAFLSTGVVQRIFKKKNKDMKEDNNAGT